MLFSSTLPEQGAKGPGDMGSRNQGALICKRILNQDLNERGQDRKQNRTISDFNIDNLDKNKKYDDKNKSAPKKAALAELQR